MAHDYITESLIQCARFGDLDGARVAIMKGANINGCAPENLKNTSAEENWDVPRQPIVGAVIGCHERVVALLLKHQPKIEIENDDHTSVWTRPIVFRSLTAGPLSILSLMLANGLNPNAQDSGGQTLLHQAIENGMSPGSTEKVIRLLLENGSDWRLKTTQGYTAEELALHYLDNGPNAKKDSASWLWACENSVRALPILKAIREQEELHAMARKLPEKNLDMIDQNQLLKSRTRLI